MSSKAGQVRAKPSGYVSAGPVRARGGRREPEGFTGDRLAPGLLSPCQRPRRRFPPALGRLAPVLALALLLPFSSATTCEHRRGVIVVDSADAPRPRKEALLVLPGFGSKSEGVKNIRKRFAHHGYDLFIPDYISRKSLERCVANLDRFMREARLDEYKKIHVFTYILGAWTLNTWMQQHPRSPIYTIVYDRSPLQERAAYTAVHDMPFLTRLALGKIVGEFSRAPYEPIANDSRDIGIIMESRATKLIRKHKKTALSPGPVDWSIAGRGQECDDYMYTLNNHDEMYRDLAEIGDEVLYFIQNGKFRPGAPREMPDIDPFMKEKPGPGAASKTGS